MHHTTTTSIVMTTTIITSNKHHHHKHHQHRQHHDHHHHHHYHLFHLNYHPHHHHYHTTNTTFTTITTTAPPALPPPPLQHHNHYHHHYQHHQHNHHHHHHHYHHHLNHHHNNHYHHHYHHYHTTNTTTITNTSIITTTITTTTITTITTAITTTQPPPSLPTPQHHITTAIINITTTWSTTKGITIIRAGVTCVFTSRGSCAAEKPYLWKRSLIEARLYLNILGYTLLIGRKIRALFFRLAKIKGFTFLPNEYRVSKLEKSTKFFYISWKSLSRALTWLHNILFLLNTKCTTKRKVCILSLYLNNFQRFFSQYQLDSSLMNVNFKCKNGCHFSGAIFSKSALGYCRSDHSHFKNYRNHHKSDLDHWRSTAATVVFLR